METSNIKIRKMHAVTVRPFGYSAVSETSFFSSKWYTEIYNIKPQNSARHNGLCDIGTTKPHGMSPTKLAPTSVYRIHINPASTRRLRTNKTKNKDESTFKLYVAICRAGCCVHSSRKILLTSLTYPVLANTFDSVLIQSFRDYSRGKTHESK